MENFRKPSLRHKAAKIDPWWKKHFKDQPFGTAGKIVSVIGGLFLLAFFWQLGFMPELDLAGTGSILMAVAFVGVVLAVALTDQAFRSNIDRYKDSDAFKAMNADVSAFGERAFLPTQGAGDAASSSGNVEES